MAENVFGIPNAHVQPVADVEARIAAGEGAYLVVMRCTDMRKTEYPPSIQKTMSIIGCTRCCEPCWYDTETYVRGTTTLCLRCLYDMPGSAQLTRGVSQESVDKVRRAKEEGR